LTTLSFDFSFPILKQLVISYNPLNAVNRVWYQSLPNASIFYDFNSCIDTTGMHQALVYRIPGEPRFAKCFENFEQLSVTTVATTPETTTIPPPTVICKYQNHRTFGYTCALSGVQSDNFVITGNHMTGKSDSDVNGVIFLRSKLAKIPSTIFNKFSKLTHLTAANIGISTADASTLESCGSLKYLDLNDNDIELIDEGFLGNCLALESVFIENNFVNRISPCNNFMKTLKSLIEVSFEYNMCLDYETSGYFYDEHLNEKYQQTFVRPLMNCFTNYLDPPIAPVFLRRKVKATQ
jgi:Leucine-rich repeat (LRR) protein